MMRTLRQDAPELWHGIVNWVRGIGIEWPEDDIARVIGKIRAKNPDDLLDAIGNVMHWCHTAERTGDDEAKAIVDLWRQLPSDVIEITWSEGRITHRLNPDMSIEVEP